MVKLFIEMGEPKRAILIMDTVDAVECKVTSGDMNYSTQKFSGELRVRDIPWERIEPGILKKLKESITYPTLMDAQQLMDKIHAILPETAEDDPTKVLREIIDVAAIDIAKTAEKNHKLYLVKSPIDSLPLKETAPNEFVVEDVKAVLDQLPTKAPTNPVAAQPIQAKPVQGGKNKHKKKGGKNTNQQNQINSNKSGKGEPPAPKASDNGYTTTIMSEYPDGYIIGHAYTDNKGDSLLIVSTPAINNNYEAALPMIFLNQSTARIVHESLLRHPRHQKMIGLAVPMPIAEIEESERNIEVALITNGITFVNSLESQDDR